MSGAATPGAGHHRGRRGHLELLGLAAAAALLVSRPDLSTLAAGLGLFLWGMTLLEEAIKRLSGGTLDRWLHTATSHPGRAIGVGALATALVQSSSLITLLAMSFVSAGLNHADTAVSAMEQECRRLDRRAYHLLCSAILMPSAEVIGHPPERRSVETPIDPDTWPLVNARYHERIKPLLAEILAFQARIDVPLTETQQERLAKLQARTLRMVEALRFGEVLQRSLLRHSARMSPLREAHDDLRLAVATGLNRLAEAQEGQTIAAPIDEVRRHWQDEMARRLRSRHLDPSLASSLMNDLHQASRLISALADPSSP